MPGNAYSLRYIVAWLPRRLNVVNMFSWTPRSKINFGLHHHFFIKRKLKWVLNDWELKKLYLTGIFDIRSHEGKTFKNYKSQINQVLTSHFCHKPLLYFIFWKGPAKLRIVKRRAGRIVLNCCWVSANDISCRTCCEYPFSIFNFFCVADIWIFLYPGGSWEKRWVTSQVFYYQWQCSGIT